MYKEGQEIDGLCLVISGEFEIFKPTLDEKQMSIKTLKSKKLQSIKITSDHEIIGLEEILTQKPKREFAVSCYSTTGKAYFIKSSDFERLIDSHFFDQKILQEILQKLHLT